MKHILNFWLVLATLFLPVVNTIGQQNTYVDESGKRIRKKKANSTIIRIQESADSFRVKRARIQDGCVLNEWVFNNRLLDTQIGTSITRDEENCQIVKETPFNSNGEIEGTVNLFYPANGKPKASIAYINGSLHGNVKSFYPDATPKRFDVYREGKLINPHTFDSSGNPKEYCGELLQPPLFQGHRDSLYKYVGNHIMYPLPAMQAGKEGKALIWVKINKEGRVICAVGISALGYGIEEATTEVFRKMPLWQPAMLDCEASGFDFIFPFTLNIAGSLPRR